MEIDAEGKLLFQGKEIDRILVDGEELFGGDNDFALNKIPAGFLSKIQVMDSKSLEQIFNGTPADGEKKTLNIKLKPGLKSFASVNAKAGTRDQSQLSLSLTQLQDRKKLFSTGNLSGQNRYGSTADGPITVNNSAGVNFSNTWGKFVLRTSYNFSENRNASEGSSRRQQFITSDSFFLSNNRNYARSESNSHRGSAGFTWNPDSMNSFTVDLSVTYSGSGNYYNSSTESFEQDKIKNLSERLNQSSGNRQSFNGSAFWGHRINRKGRGFTISWKHMEVANGQTGFNRSRNDYYLAGQFDKRDSTDQRQVNNNSNGNGQLNFSFTEPLNERLRIQVRSDISYQLNQSDRYTYLKDSLQQYKSYDSVYSNELSSRILNHINTLYLYYNYRKLNLYAGMSAMADETTRKLGNKENYRQKQINYAPSASATYNIGEMKSLRMSFSGRTVQANLEQLQPLPDNANPLYIKTGNPGLKNAFVQSYSGVYSQTFVKGDNSSMFSLSLSWSPEVNSIVNAVSYDAYRRQTSQWVNADRLYSASGNLSFSRSFLANEHYNVLSVTAGNNSRRNVYFHTNRMLYTKENSIRANLSLDSRKKLARFSNGFTVGVSFHYGFNRTPEDLNALNSTQMQVMPHAEASYNFFKKLNVNAGYQGAFYDADYNSGKQPRSRYSQHSLQTSLDYSLYKNCGIHTSLAFNKSTGRFSALNDKVTWNAEAYASFFKDRRLYLRLEAYDLLNSNRSFNQFQGIDYIQQNFSSNLRNYITLQLQYNLSKLKKEKRTS